MTREGAINALDIVKHIESIFVFYEPGEPMNQTTVGELKEACKMAISILRAQTDTPPNNPLTLKQLREMDGEPVWVQYGQYDGEWLIVAWNIYDAISYARKAPFKLSVYSYGDTWLAYRRKPEEGTT